MTFHFFELWETSWIGAFCVTLKIKVGLVLHVSKLSLGCLIELCIERAAYLTLFLSYLSLNQSMLISFVDIITFFVLCTVLQTNNSLNILSSDYLWFRIRDLRYLKNEKPSKHYAQ